MAFKKTCYICGAKVDKLYNSKCEQCFKEEHPPISEIKPINIKYCNSCKKINYANQFITKEELEKRLPEIVIKHTVIDNHYKLTNLEIENFKIEGSKVSFDVEVDCELK